MREYLPHSTMCFVCGSENHRGLKCRFFVELERVCAEVTVPNGFNGYQQVVHGGIQTAILDEAMGWAAYVHGPADSLYFTRGIEVKFRANVPIEETLHIVTDLLDVKRGIATVRGEILDSSGKSLSQSTGSFVPVPQEKMHETMQYLRMEDNVPYYEKALRIFGDKTPSR